MDSIDKSQFKCFKIKLNEDNTVLTESKIEQTQGTVGTQIDE